MSRSGRRGDRNGRAEPGGGVARRGRHGARPERPARSTPRDGRVEPRTEHTPFHLSNDIVRELHITARPGKGEILVKVFGEAAGAFADEDYDAAALLGDQAKHIALRSPTVRELLGLAYYRAGRFKDAARELSAYRRLSGSNAHNPVIADCYRADGKPDKAVELCDEVVPDDGAPVLYEAAIVAAGALMDMGKLDDAIARLNSLDLDPPIAQEHHLRAWYALADLLQKRGRFTHARYLFEAVDAADPELTDAGDRLTALPGANRDAPATAPGRSPRPPAPREDL